MRKNSFILLTSFLISVAACKKEEHGPILDSGKEPSPISNLSVENLPGGAKITYSLPDDADVLYIKARFDRMPGLPSESKSSYYNNYVVVEGAGDTLEREVTLTVVSKSNRESTPVTIKIQPLLPPVHAIARSIKMKEDFGGVNIAYENPTKADVAVAALTDTGKGLEVMYTHYSKVAEANFSIRGYKAEPRRFSAVVRDRWGNTSDTISGTYTPIPEVRLDVNKFSPIVLPTDIPSETNWGDMGISRLWDGSINGWDFWHSKPSNTMPMWFTMNLGVKTQLSRIMLWQRQDDRQYMYAQNNVKKIEIWGTEQFSGDGSWDNWRLLKEHTLVKPSGLPLGQVNDDDVAAVQKGEEMIIPYHEPVQFIRVKIIETWQFGGKTANIAEIVFFGQP